MKLVALIALVALMVFCGIGLLTGGKFHQLTLSALIAGMILFAVVSLLGDGLLNLLTVIRHLRGTLEETSRESLRRTAKSDQ